MSGSGGAAVEQTGGQRSQKGKEGGGRVGRKGIDQIPVHVTTASTAWRRSGSSVDCLPVIILSSSITAPLHYSSFSSGLSHSVLALAGGPMQRRESQEARICLMSASVVGRRRLLLSHRANHRCPANLLSQPPQNHSPLCRVRALAAAVGYSSGWIRLGGVECSSMLGNLGAS